MKPTLALSTLLLTAPATAAAAYDHCPSTDWAVSTIALEVEQAYIARKALDLRSAMSDLTGAVGCLNHAISPETAAAVHRAAALVALSQNDDAGATAAMQAALMAEPGWVPSPELAPPASELAMTIEWAQVGQLPTYSTLSTSSGLGLRLDGVPSWRRPDQLPVVFQLIDREGHPIHSAYLRPGDPVPEAVDPTTDGREAPPSSFSEPRHTRDRSTGGPLRVTLMGGTGALAATALGLGLASAQVKADWTESVDRCESRSEGCSPQTARLNEQDALRAKRLGLGAGVAAAGSVALGVGLIITW